MGWTPWCLYYCVWTQCALKQLWIINDTYVYRIYTVHDTNIYILPRPCRVGFPRVTARQYLEAHAAICGRLRNYAMRKTSVNEHAIVRTRLKTVIGCWRSIFTVRLVWGFQSWSSHFVTRSRLRNMFVGIFDANSYYRARQLSWLRLTSDFKFVAIWF